MVIDQFDRGEREVAVISRHNSPAREGDECTTCMGDGERPVDGPSATFACRRMAPRGGVPLILLNRVRGTIDWWDPELLDQLAVKHDVIVFDKSPPILTASRGSGSSNWTRTDFKPVTGTS